MDHMGGMINIEFSL